MAQLPSNVHVPACILQVHKEQPVTPAPPLTDAESVKASASLINKTFVEMDFPKKVRFRVDPPIPQQHYCVHTFVPSKGAKPDSDGWYGIVKCRGTTNTEHEAVERCENIIRFSDSYNENDIALVGHEFPLTENSRYTGKVSEVDIRSKMDKIAREKVVEEKKKESKEMKDMQERQKLLLADTTEHKEISIDDLDYYTQLRVKRANLRMIQEECERKIRDCGKLIKKTTSELNDLDEKHPEYQKEYEDKYRRALEAIGGDSHNNPIIDYMK
jgi:hypothetical protein